MIDHLEGLRIEIDRFQSSIDDLDAHIPTCPDWRVRDLIHHLGSVHRTFRRVADEGWMQRPPVAENDDRPSAADDRVVDWAAEQAQLLLAALERLEPTAPRWNFSPAPQVGAFIPRRMHHETTIHRWDLEGAVGSRTPIDDGVAIDGIHEYLAVFLLRSGVWSGPSSVLHTVVTAGPTYELILEAGSRSALNPEPQRRPDIVVAGEPEPLLLAWWDRVPLVDHLTDGEVALLDQVRRFAYT